MCLSGCGPRVRIIRCTSRVVRVPLSVVTWRCFSGCGPRTLPVPGRMSVVKLKVVTWRYCGGCVPRTLHVPGMHGAALVLLVVVTWRFCSGCGPKTLPVAKTWVDCVHFKTAYGGHWEVIVVFIVAVYPGCSWLSLSLLSGIQRE